MKSNLVFGNTRNGIAFGQVAVQPKVYSGHTFLIICVIEYAKKSMGIHFLYLTEHQWCVILKNIHILIALKEKSNLQCELKRAGDSGSLVQGADEGRSGAISHKVGMIFYCANQGGTAGIQSLVPVVMTGMGDFLFYYKCFEE